MAEVRNVRVKRHKGVLGRKSTPKCWGGKVEGLMCQIKQTKFSPYTP